MQQQQPRKGRHIVINDMNINSNLLVKHCNTLHNTSLWHKILVVNCVNLDKKYVLKTIMDAVHPHDFIPVNYVVEESFSSFLIKNCPSAIKQLCQQNLIVRNPNCPERPFKFCIVLGFASTQEIKINMEEKISPVIKKRYNNDTKILNLDSFYKDTDLDEFCPLSQPKILLFVLHICKSYPFLSLRLSNNEIKTLDALDALISLKVTFSLDLRNNMIEKDEDLKVLASILISEILLEGNPICDNISEPAYLRMIKEHCPKVKKIDGIAIWNSFQPFRRNYLCNLEGKELIDQFLEYYFTLYDTANRNLLENIYHPDAIFTLTSHYISGQLSSMNVRLINYKKYSRNIKFLSNLSKCDEFVFRTPKRIIPILCDLPLSEHDPYSFTVDQIHYTEKSVIFVVTGIFREPAESLSASDRYLSFSRTFVLLQASKGRYVIVNEVLHVNNATTTQQQSCFKHARITGNVSIPPPKDETEKNEMIVAMKRISTLNKHWSKKYLEEANYDLKQALIAFIDMYKSDKLPEDAFSEDGHLKPSANPPTSTPNDINIDSNLEHVDMSFEDEENPPHLQDAENYSDPNMSGVDPKLVHAEKNVYYNVELKRLGLAKTRGDLPKAMEIALNMMIKYKEDAVGYKQMQQLCFENKDLEGARNVLQKAKINLVKKKYMGVLKAYFGCELHYGNPQVLVNFIEKEMSQLRVVDFIIEYLKALIKCNHPEKASEVAKSNLKIIKSEPRCMTLLRQLEAVYSVKLV